MMPHMQLRSTGHCHERASSPNVLVIYKVYSPTPDALKTQLGRCSGESPMSARGVGARS